MATSAPGFLETEINALQFYANIIISSKTSSAKTQLTYNHGHNILELFNVLIQTRLTTSKSKCDIEYSKLGIRVASRVAERLKT